MASDSVLQASPPTASGRGNTSLRPFIVTTVVFSFFVNLLMLVSPLYMLQVYDRVLSSGSVETLVMVSIAAIGMLSAYGFAEAARRKSLALMSDYLQDQYGSQIFKVSLSNSGSPQSLPKRLSDLSTVQNFLQHGLPLPLFDLPFTPIFIFAMFLVHPIIGWIGVVGGCVLILITVLTEIWSRDSVKEAQQAETETTNFAHEISRRSSVVTSLGMLKPLTEQWKKHKSKSSDLTLRGLSKSTFFSAQARSLRQMLQVAALGVGGYLVLQLEVSAGAIIAGSILMGRALAPIDQALGAWRQLIKARQSWAGLKEVNEMGDKVLASPTPLPRPKPELSIEALQVSTPNAEKPLLPKFNLNLQAGSVLAILGPSGTGKTSLLQTCVGAWQPFDGIVRLGGRDIHRWDESDRGQYLGYAPQNIDLLPGTVSQNICRFSDAPADMIIEAAEKAGFHDMILRLPDGYDTDVGTGGTHLSHGQKKAVGLSRAFFGNPVFLALDEPGSNLDQISLVSFRKGLAEMKASGTIIIFSTHDVRFLSLADNIMLLDKGALKMLSAKEYLTTLRQSQSVTWIESL